MRLINRQTLYHLFCGAVMGTADMIPGVSGGTMALVLGIYARLVAAMNVLKAPFLSLLLKARLRDAACQLDWALLLPLALGLLLAIAVMVKVVALPQLLREYPQYVYALFFGLIVGSVPLLLRKERPPAMKWLWLVLGGAIGFALTQLVPTSLPDNAAMSFASGSLAISAMLLPGISGSYILLILGKYAQILEALEVMDVTVIVPFVAGCGVGLVVFSKLLHWVMEHYHAKMLWLMAGLLLGTLPKVWPFQLREYALVHGKEKLMSSTLYWPEILVESAGVVAALVALGVLIAAALGRIKQASGEG